MKKILLALMMMVSFLFSSTCQPYVVDGSKIYTLSSAVPVIDQYIYNYGKVNYNGNSATYMVGDAIVGCVRGDCIYSGVTYCTYTYTVTCTSSQILVNGQCVDPLECDNTKGTFTNLDGQCTDCSSHLADKDVDSMANCSCGATGSSWNNGSVYSNSVTNGGKTYWQSKIKCTDGSEKYVYYGEATPTDTNNSTTPNDNNTTTPNDNNTTNQNDNNGTIPSDGNGTKPNDGNGTKPGNSDYSAVLSKMLEKLTNIQDASDNISKGIHGTYEITSQSPGVIPGDVSGGNWNTYQETWGNIIDSVNQVSDKVGQFQGLVQNGFSNPFSKGATTTCRYTTSFEFGDVGSIPVNFDLCSIVSPLHSVFYTFAYIFFVYAILSFCVKMFLRLV